MCGIFALFLDHPLTDADIALGRAGVEALHYRGPDSHGEWIDREAGVFIGHTRLAIIDLTENSRQPMVRGKNVLSYNGELYNHREIRTDLKAAGTMFSTNGDTEVVLAALNTWGPRALDRFDGMFAFAMWDGEQALLATDPFSEKPLVWLQRQDGIVVSSEVAPLARLSGTEPGLAGDSLTSYLALGYVPAPETAYPTIKRLPAGTCAVVKDGCVGQLECYWTPPVAEPGKGAPRPLDEAALDHLQGALADSLRGRLISDVSMCVFLSAGVDSSLIAAMAKRDFDADVAALSVAFSGSPHTNEAPLAAETAAYLGLRHSTVAGTQTRGVLNLNDVIDLHGQPCDATTAVSIHQMTDLASADYKVGLTGSGGDEVFFGYGKHAHFSRFRYLYNSPEPFRLAMGVLARLAHPLHRGFGRLAFDMGTANHERYLAQKNFPVIAWLRGHPGFDNWARRHFNTPLERIETVAAAYEIRNVMPNSRLIAMDTGSMRASFELRTPFLSRAVVEAVAQYDPRAFFAFGQKAVLRRILKRYLPEHLVDRPKRGFSYPSAWLMHQHLAAPPAVPGVAPGQVAEVWRHLEDGDGWMRLAIRLAMLSDFTAACRPPASS
jgi:asparagine synthase (glutamine-hydrolysing)